MSEFGVFVKRKREDKNISIRKLAEQTGFSYQYLNRVENGTTTISNNVLEKLIEIFPEHKKELIRLYLQETLPKNVTISDIFALDDSYVIYDVLSQKFNTKERKEVYKFFLDKLIIKSIEQNKYESDKKLIDKVKQLIEML